MTRMSTLCYLLWGDQVLMLHRTIKEQDVNHGKWIGVGGHFEADESPEECLLREVWEETGYTLTAWQFRGIVTFVSGDGVTEYMHLFTADGFSGKPHPCDEGELAWVPRDTVWGLNLWEGDRVFFRLLMETEAFFSLKLMYDGHDRLTYAALNGRPMELFDVLDESGRKTGVVRERGVAHRDGSLRGRAGGAASKACAGQGLESRLLRHFVGGAHCGRRRGDGCGGAGDARRIGLDRQP